VPPVWSLMDVERDRPIATRVIRADTFLTRLKGLLGRRRLEADEGLWIEPCDSVHTFFMRFPIDVAFVDRKGVMIRGIARLRPWRVTRLYAGARACVELAAGTLEAFGLREGSRLVLTSPLSPKSRLKPSPADGAPVP
jgi:uncharacterized membrane protein (UPF0127 family)